MSTTDTHADTIQRVLDEANPSQLASALQKIALGSMLTPIQETVTIAAGTVINLPTDTVAKKAAQQILTCRVTAGTATGNRVVTDSTPCAPVGAIPGLVTLSADGTALTFEANITVAVITWLPVPANAMSAFYAPKSL